MMILALEMSNKFVTIKPYTDQDAEKVADLWRWGVSFAEQTPVLAYGCMAQMLSH